MNRLKIFAISACLLLCIGVICSQAGTVTYTYDEAGRLSNATYGNGKNVVHSYDTRGNLIQVNIADAGMTTGSLQVTITPAEAVTAGAQWQVDGGAWQNSGAIVGNLTAGAHTVAFKDVTGWTKPANQSATVQASQTAALTGIYAQAGQQTGSLQVTITPAEAITAGAQWQVDGGAWQNSGAIVGNLAVGAHTVSFKYLAGWTQPANQMVNIQNAQTAAAAGIYQQQVTPPPEPVYEPTVTATYVGVTLTPIEAVNAGAQWRISGSTWQNSGSLFYGLAFGGDYTLEFKDISGWNKPADKKLVSGDMGNMLNAAYVRIPQPGSLTVTITPEEAASAGVQWRVNGGEWQNSGATVSNLAIGEHKVTFKEVSGWAKPADQSVNIAEGQTLKASAASVKTVIPTGSLTVAISPANAGGQWQSDNGEWQNSGATLSNLSIGEHQIAFKDLPGWIKPNNQIVNIVQGQTATISAEYRMIPVQSGSLTVTISPVDAVGAQWQIDGGAWQNSGATLTNLSIGSHTIAFKDVSGWNKPADQTITIQNGQTAVSAGIYTKIRQPVGSLSVRIEPADAVSAGAQWQIDGGAWQNSGSSLAELSIGSHSVSFKDVSGWTKPALRTVTIEDGKTASISVKYEKVISQSDDDGGSGLCFIGTASH